MYKKPVGIFRNNEVRKEIKKLDAQNDHVRIVHLMTAYEFPWDMTKALELALFRTFASPSVAKLLAKTGEFEKRGQKRYDDTSILIGEFMEKGYDNPVGKRAIEQMNKIHARFDISNEDYLFVLSTFVLDPIDWINKYGYRQLYKNEENALFYFFYEIGKRMNLEAIPSSLENLIYFADEYSKKHFVYSDKNRRVAEATIRIVENWYPAFVHFMIKPAVNAMIDKKMRDAFGFEEHSPLLGNILHYTLKLRRIPNRVFNFESSPTLLANTFIRTYPKNDYKIEEIGPDKIIKKKN